MPDVDGNLVASSARLHPCVFIIIQRLSPLKTLRKSYQSIFSIAWQGLENTEAQKD